MSDDDIVLLLVEVIPQLSGGVDVWRMEEGGVIGYSHEALRISSFVDNSSGSGMCMQHGKFNRIKNHRKILRTFFLEGSAEICME